MSSVPSTLERPHRRDNQVAPGRSRPTSPRSPLYRRRFVHTAAVAVATCASAALTLAAGAAAAAPASASGPSAATIIARSGMNSACDSASSSVARCNAASLLAIDMARSEEGLPRLVLPNGYIRMGVIEQLDTVTNAERLARGLPAWSGPWPGLAAEAAAGIATSSDPTGPLGRTWVSNLAVGVLTVLQADFEWMYDDGPGGTNLDCRPPSWTYCWVHRDNILRRWPADLGIADRPTAGGRLALGELAVEVPRRG